MFLIAVTLSNTVQNRLWPLTRATSLKQQNKKNSIENSNKVEKCTVKFKK